MAGLQQKLWLVGTWPVLQKENNKIPNFKTGNNFETISVLLILASQRIEDVLGWDGHEGDSSVTKRGAKPSLVESCILAWVTGLIWSEIKQLWDVGLKEYINDMWNVVDFITNSLYVATIGLRTVAYFDVRHQSYWWHKGRFTSSYLVLPCVTLCYIMLLFVTLCYTMLHYVILCYIMLHYVTLCYFQVPGFTFKWRVCQWHNCQVPTPICFLVWFGVSIEMLTTFCLRSSNLRGILGHLF